MQQCFLAYMITTTQHLHHLMYHVLVVSQACSMCVTFLLPSLYFPGQIIMQCVFLHSQTDQES